MVLPGYQPCRDEKTGHIGGGVPLYLKDNTECNSIKMLQEKEVCYGISSNKASW